MHALVPWRFGAALALTVIIGYAFCTLLWVAFTGPAIGFLNALFHGLDFRRLAMPDSFSFGAAIYAAIVLAVWAFLIGVLFARVRNGLSVVRSSS
jgi:2TM family of unknown function (DUF5676)